MANEYDFFQINDPGSIGADWKGGDRATQLRPIGSRMSDWRDLNIGIRRSDDYNRTVFQWKFEQNNSPELGKGFGTDWAYYNYNPYVLGSTVKKVLDDQGFKMTMSHNYGAQLDPPGREMSDSNGIDPSGMVSFKNYPSEGAIRFRLGQKGVKSYVAAGNSWLRMPV